jgi:hypothetical protein
VAPVSRHFVDGSAVAEGQFLRLSRILVDIVPAADALDDEALREAVDARVGRQAARILTAEHAELYAAKQEQRRRDAPLAFEEKVEIVLELQEASRPMREGAGAPRPGLGMTRRSCAIL